MTVRTGIIALVPDRWTDIHMPRHQVIKRLAAHFPVVWVEPPKHWREYILPHGPHFLEHDQWAEPVPGLEVLTPGFSSPLLYKPRWAERMTMASRLETARRRLVSRGAQRVALYIWRDKFGSALDLVDHDISCYHVDDEYTFSDVEIPNSSSEVALLRRVDQVIVHSPALLGKKGGFNPNTALVSNGVDFKSFSKPHEEPADLQRIPHPRIGYVGVIKKQLNLELMLGLAKARPDYSFVFVGPILNVSGKERFVDELQKRPNVFFIGNRTPAELPAYVQSIDVCLMCYEVNSYTKYIYPLKLNEYLAAARPVVSARIDAVRNCGDVLAFADTESEWLEAIDNALRPTAGDPGLAQARRDHARRHDWDLLVERIAGLFQAALSRKHFV